MESFTPDNQLPLAGEETAEGLLLGVQHAGSHAGADATEEAVFSDQHPGRLAGAQVGERSVFRLRHLGSGLAPGRIPRGRPPLRASTTSSKFAAAARCHQTELSERAEVGGGVQISPIAPSNFSSGSSYSRPRSAPAGDQSMTPAQDPFYIVKDEIQDSIDKVQDTFNQWKQTPENTGEYVHLTRELLTTCESVQWQVDELEKAISVAERDPAYYGLNEVEIGKRRNWTSTARNQVVSIRRNVEAGKHKTAFGRSVNPSELGRSKQHIAQDNDDFIASESDQQMLLMKQQDDELDMLSASVQRIGGVGLTIHEELVGQEKLLGELSLDMETTSNRLDFVQKRVAMVLKKASLKGQIMMIAFLVILFIILFVLVFLT
ncbi:hypothetical protein ACQ4PT_035756 [Festuca glaucescens]